MTDDGIVRRHLWVSGRVQGVWYRDSTETEARRLGVSGWCRNLRDLRVEVVAEGPAPAVDALVAWCHEGPPRANVSGVEVREERPEGLEGFVVHW